MLIGITGGLATGKSTVARMLQQKGAVVFSADEAARAVLTPGGPALSSLVAAFGPEILLPDGSLDRAYLGKRIFADPIARERVNRILHPPILRLLRAQIEGARDDLPSGSVIALEVPLLFETQMQDWFELIVVVTASESKQIERLLARNGLDETEARRRLAAQWPLADKVAQADYVVVNDGSPDTLAAAVDALWAKLHSVRAAPDNQTAVP